MKILKISKINSNISENIKNDVFGSCGQYGIDSIPCITPIGTKWNLGFSESTIMVENQDLIFAGDFFGGQFHCSDLEKMSGNRQIRTFQEK